MLPKTEWSSLFQYHYCTHHQVSILTIDPFPWELSVQWLSEIYITKSDGYNIN